MNINSSPTESQNDHSPSASRISLIISQIDESLIHAKTQTIELRKIIEERIGSLTEEVEIATNVELNPLYIVDRKDEIESLRWTTRIIRWVLNQGINGQQQLAVNKIQLELEDTKKFENMLHDKIKSRDRVRRFKY